MVKRRKQKSDWTPATEFKVIKLKPNGPKPGQSTDRWLFGKQREEEEFQARKQRLIERGQFPMS